MDSELPLLFGNGFHILRGDVRGAVKFIMERGAGSIRQHRGGQPVKLRNRAESLTPDPMAVRR